MFCNKPYITALLKSWCVKLGEVTQYVSRRNGFVDCGFYKGKRLAVLTSGGDSPGMNSALRAIVRTGIYLGCKVYFIKEGFEGMITGGPLIQEAQWTSVSFIIHRGGTMIGSARSTAFREKEGRMKAAHNLIKNGINNLVVIGGDGSLTGANIFKSEWAYYVKTLLSQGLISGVEAKEFSSLNIVGLVGSIDNDFTGTDMTIGTDSALHRIMESVDAIVSTAYSHKRTFILEIMGRHCGYLALVAAIGCEADYLFIPEHPPPDDWPTQLCDKLVKDRASGQRLNIILVSEGAIDRHGKAITVDMVKDVIVKNLKHDARITVLGHVQRGGNPSAFDRMLSSRMGAAAVITLMEAKPGQQALVVTLEGNQIVQLPLMKCVKDTHDVGQAMERGDWDLAMKLRGKRFAKNLETYEVLSSIKQSKIGENAKRYTLGVISIGSPACGINAAVFAFVRSCMNRGDTVFGIHNSIDGLCDGNFQRMQWSDVDGWVRLGGSVLGTKKTLPADKYDIIAAKLKEYNIQGLLIIGGFQAFQSAVQFIDQRNNYPEFRIPILVLPATINNNVTGTDFSLGTDTSLNEITEICDRIRQSAQGTKRRVFIIETMGGYCGYLATIAGLTSGADVAYIYEERFSIKDLEKGVYHMASKMADGVLRGLIIRNENCNENYDAKFMHRLYAEEGKGLFSARMNILGHMQQGGSPSPYDRSLGIKFGVQASAWFETQLSNLGVTSSSQMPNATDYATASVLGVVQRKYVFTSVKDLEKQTNFQYFLPKDQWWLKLRPLLSILAKHPSAYQHESAFIEVGETITESELANH